MSGKFDTCFFERYARITLSTLLGREFDCLENRDRPDLQSPDGKSIGIEVTRAMEESRDAERELLMDMAGITKGRSYHEIDQILQYGYSFGLGKGRYIGAKELMYWKMALPMRRIIESKVNKAGNGFYGQFDKMGLYIFSKEDLEERDAIKIMHYTIGCQKYQSIKYNRLYLADVNDLYVCNLEDGLQENYRTLRYLVTKEQREEFYRKAVEDSL